jgi:Flp pilus assembly pilin Flp
MDPDAAPEDHATKVLGASRRSDRRRERAATLVEYALIVAVFAIGTLAAVDLLQDNAAKTTENTADNISSGPR